MRRCRQWGIALVVVAAALGGFFWLRPAPTLVEIRRLVAQRDWAPAERALSRFLRSDASHAEALLLLAKVRKVRGNPTGAVDCLQRIGSLSSVKPQVLFQVSEIFWEFHLAARAERCWRQILENAGRAGVATNVGDTPWDYWALARLGDLLLLESRDDEARAVLWRLFERVERRDAAAVDFLMQLTVFDLESESPTVGLETLRPFVEADPADVQAHRAMASYCLRLGKTDEAGEILRNLMHQDPQVPGVYETWVQYLMRTGARAAARQALEKVPESLEPTAGLWKLRGMDHENHGQFDDAVACYRKALDLAPRSHELQSRLAQALRAAGQTELFEQQNERVKRHSFWLTELSAYLGRFPRRPGNRLGVEPCRQLANYCEQLGWLREAKAWHELVLAREPGEAASQKAIRELEQKLSEVQP